MKFRIRLLLFVINRDNNYDSVGVDILNFDSMRDLIFGWFLAIKMVEHQEENPFGWHVYACLRARSVASIYVWVPIYLVTMAQFIKIVVIARNSRVHSVILTWIKWGFRLLKPRFICCWCCCDRVFSERTTKFGRKSLHWWWKQFNSAATAWGFSTLEKIYNKLNYFHWLNIMGFFFLRINKVMWQQNFDHLLWRKSIFFSMYLSSYLRLHLIPKESSILFQSIYFSTVEKKNSFAQMEDVLKKR